MAIVYGIEKMSCWKYNNLSPIQWHGLYLGLLEAEKRKIPYNSKQVDFLEKKLDDLINGKN